MSVAHFRCRYRLHAKRASQRSCNSNRSSATFTYGPMQSLEYPNLILPPGGSNAILPPGITECRLRKVFCMTGIPPPVTLRSRHLHTSKLDARCSEDQNLSRDHLAGEAALGDSEAFASFGLAIDSSTRFLKSPWSSWPQPL